MNLARGLFRLWIVGSVLWVIFLLFIVKPTPGVPPVDPSKVIDLDSPDQSQSAPHNALAPDDPFEKYLNKPPG
jgi:hypothetical protein